MKRTYSSLLSLGLALIFFLSFVGCNKSGNTSGNTGSNKSPSNSSSPSSSPSTSSSPGKGASASNFVGTWRPGNGEGSGESPFRLTIKDDGTYMIASKNNEGQSIKGTYTVSGDTMTLSDPEGKGDEGIATIESDGRLKIEGSKSKGAEYFVKE